MLSMISVFHLFISEFSKSNRSLWRTKQLHSLSIKLCLSENSFYATQLVRLYALNKDIDSAHYVFDRTPNKSVYLWNSVIRAYAQARRFSEAYSLFQNMLATEIRPDNFTYACIIRACYEDLNLLGLRHMHGGLTVSGFALDYICCSALVTAYSKLSLVDEASKVFHQMTAPDLVLWNSMISGYGYSGFWDKAMKMFSVMRYVGIKPDSYTIVGLMLGLGYSSCLLTIGEGIHGFIIKNGFHSNDHVASLLVNIYSRCKCMNSAFEVCCSMVQLDLVTWSALISGYSQSGENEKALLFFRAFNFDGKKADIILIASVLASIACSANVWPGLEIHGYILRHGLELDVMVSSSLVDMYSKCGFLHLAIQVFDTMPRRNIISYNSLILALALHGHAAQAMDTFNRMLEKGLTPNESTFTALLCACSHAGLVQEGQNIFNRMKAEFCIQPRNDHYVHIVKLLGMAGRSEEAYCLIQSLPEPVDDGILGSFLSCAVTSGNSKLAELVALKLITNSPTRSTYKVMLSNIYAGEGKWDNVKKLRDEISKEGPLKVPGISLVNGLTIKEKIGFASY